VSFSTFRVSRFLARSLAIIEFLRSSVLVQSSRELPTTAAVTELPPTPNSNRNPVSTLYKIRTLLGPLKGAFSPSNQCKIAVHSAPHQLSVRGWCGDYNANFSIVGKVVLLHLGAMLATFCGSARLLGLLAFLK
jgi:hypothetical protein